MPPPPPFPPPRCSVGGGTDPSASAPLRLGTSELSAVPSLGRPRAPHHPQPALCLPDPRPKASTGPENAAGVERPVGGTKRSGRCPQRDSRSWGREAQLGSEPRTLWAYRPR